MLSALDGYKTYIGFVLYMVGSWLGPGDPAPDLLPEAIAGLLVQAGIALGGLGLIHKIAKLEG